MRMYFMDSTDYIEQIIKPLIKAEYVADFDMEAIFEDLLQCGLLKYEEDQGYYEDFTSGDYKSEEPYADAWWAVVERHDLTEEN